MLVIHIRIQEPYWELYLNCYQKQKAPEHERLRLKYYSPEREAERAHGSLSSECILTEREADRIRGDLAAEALIESISHRKSAEKPPKLFDLTALQKCVSNTTYLEALLQYHKLNLINREANRRFGFTAERTLSTLQQLYETRKLISYPRTDSRYLTPDLLTNINQILK